MHEMPPPHQPGGGQQCVLTLRRMVSTALLLATLGLATAQYDPARRAAWLLAKEAVSTCERATAGQTVVESVACQSPSLFSGQSSGRAR
jgi:hypothetical protein